MFAATFTGLRRLGIGALAAAAFVASSRAEDAPASTPRTVREIRVRIACDEEWRALPDWEALAKRRLAEASGVFEKQFAIRWTAVDVVPWMSDDGAASLALLLEQLERDVPRGGSDIVLGFTCQERAKGADREYALAGVAEYFGPAALVRGVDAGPRPQWHVGALVHELGHVLGAWHSANFGSVMWEHGDRPSFDTFDEQSAAVIELCRELDFARGPDWLDAPRRRAMREIYRSGHSAGTLVPYVDVEMRRAWQTFTKDKDQAALRASYRHALGEQRACVGPEDPSLVTCLRELAWADMQGPSHDLDEAECLARLARTLATASGVTEDPVLASEAVLADVAWERGRHTDATVAYRRVYAARLDASGAADPRTEDIRTVLVRRGGLAVPAKPWQEVKCAMDPPSPADACPFDTPAPGTIHVGPLPDTPLAGAASWADRVCVQFAVATPQPGELALELREIGAASRAGPSHAVKARVPAGWKTRVWLTFATEGARPGAETARYTSEVAIAVPGAETATSSGWFPGDAPWNARLRLSRVTEFRPAGFVRVPANSSVLLRSWDWIAEPPAAVALTVRGRDVTIDGPSGASAAAAAKCSWRLELTFTPDAAK